MEFSYSAIKQMDVISVSDGRHLGKVCDIIFDFPENKIRGFYVTGCKGFRFGRQDVFLPVNTIVRIGEDVIITDIDASPPPKEKPCRKSASSVGQQDDCPHDCCPGVKPGKDRRSYDEYE